MVNATLSSTEISNDGGDGAEVFAQERKPYARRVVVLLLVVVAGILVVALSVAFSGDSNENSKLISASQIGKSFLYASTRMFQ